MGDNHRTGIKHSDETKRQIGLSNTGKKRTAETKLKMRLAKLGKKRSEETKQKISENNARYWKGKSLSKDTLEKARSALKGKFFSDDRKRNCSILVTGERNPFYGKKHTEETKKKISDAKLGKITSRKGKKFTEEHKANLKLARLHQIMPINDTSIELKVKKQLKDNNIEFIHPWILCNKYQYDFFVPDLNLIIECDGDYWHSLPKSLLRDKMKNNYARENGYSIMRLPEHIIKDKKFDIKFALNGIDAAICI